MLLTKTPFKDLYVIEFPHFNDARGAFQKVWSQDLFSTEGISVEIKEIYYSINKKDVIRGMHFQTPPHDHTKIVYVSKGVIMDIALDIRKESPTFGRYFSIELNDENGKAILIPPGFAHGFLSLKDDTIVNYAQSSCYAPEHDCGIAYNSFGLDWPVENPIISPRDLQHPSLADFKSPF